MIRNEIKKNILSFELYNAKLCKLRIKGKFNNLPIISVHAPTEEKSDEEKEKFYEDLQIVRNKISKHNIVIILGDLNAKIGKRMYTKMLEVNTHSMRPQTDMESGPVNMQLQIT